jgi:tetratricopeptide (TPR) repeat protein
MLRHQPYFELLATLEETSPVWTSTLAGLAVLNLVDAARDDRTIIDSDWPSMRAVSDQVMAIREGNPIRRPLVKVLDELRGGPSWSVINLQLFAYGRALDLDGVWSLAVDVFDTVADIARAERDHQVAIDATTALGGAARRSGDWDRSAEGYAEAAYLADALGDKASGLTVRIGRANTQIARGNLPAAQSIVDDVIAEASKSSLDGVLALANHAGATVAFLQKRYDDAVTLGYKALRLTTNPNIRDNIMADMGGAFFMMGRREAARDVYLITSMTSRYQWVRWQAAINLMEIASYDGNEDAFDDYGRELRNAALDPRLRSYFLLLYGEGAMRLGRHDDGLRSIEEARDFATAHKIYQVAHDAGRALVEGERAVRADEAAKVWSAEPVREDVALVMSELSHLRERALSSPPVDDWR